jgi:hypothetical protein
MCIILILIVLRVVTPEEMEAKYQRIVVSSLQGYALYLQKLPAEHLQAAHEANKKLIASKKFWNLSKHTSALIRNAWFSALIALCQKAPDLLVDEGPHAAVAVFGNLDETDPTVLPTVWEALLHVLTTVQVTFFKQFFSCNISAQIFFGHIACAGLEVTVF